MLPALGYRGNDPLPDLVRVDGEANLLDRKRTSCLLRASQIDGEAIELPRCPQRS